MADTSFAPSGATTEIPLIDRLRTIYTGWDDVPKSERHHRAVILANEIAQVMLHADMTGETLHGEYEVRLRGGEPRLFVSNVTYGDVKASRSDGSRGYIDLCPDAQRQFSTDLDHNLLGELRRTFASRGYFA